MTDAATIAGAFGGKRNGDGWLVPCTVSGHGQGRGDRNPSLSIRDGDKALLVRCFAGCNSGDVLDSLRSRGLLADRDWPTNSVLTDLCLNPHGCTNLIRPRLRFGLQHQRLPDRSSKPISARATLPCLFRRRCVAVRLCTSIATPCRQWLRLCSGLTAGSSPRKQHC
jgi:hypothetical protein